MGILFIIFLIGVNNKTPLLGNSQRVVVRNVVQGVKGRREDRKELLFYSSQGKLHAAFLLPASSLRCSGFSYFCLPSRLINIFRLVFHHSRFRFQPVWLGCISYPIILRLKNSFETYITWESQF